MNVLFLSARKLLPLTGGAEIGSNSLLKYLYSIGAYTTVLSFYEKKDYSDEETEVLLGYVKKIRSVKLKWSNVALNFSIKYPNNIRKYTRQAMRELIEDEINSESYDLIISDHLQMFEYCKGIKGKRIILNEHNVEYKVWESYSERCRKVIRPFVLLTASRIKRYEKKACLTAESVIVVSEEDKKILRNISPDANIEVMIPMSEFEQVKFKQDIEKVKNTLLFVGSYSWYPNRLAAKFLVEEVMPILRERKLGYKLFLVGKNPTEAIVEYGKCFSDVIVTGMVESVEPYYREGDLFVNSVTDGGGINIKMLEAMARGIPVITSEFGLRGFKTTSLDFTRVYHTADECAEIIIELMKDRSQAFDMAKKARRVYEEYIKPSHEIENMILGK